MAPRVLVIFLLALAALGGRAEAFVDDAATASVVVADAAPASEAEAQEEEATDPPVQTPDSDRRAADARTAPSAGDWRADPEVRPPRR